MRPDEGRECYNPRLQSDKRRWQEDTLGQESKAFMSMRVQIDSTPYDLLSEHSHLIAGMHGTATIVNEDEDQEVDEDEDEEEDDLDEDDDDEVKKTKWTTTNWTTTGNLSKRMTRRKAKRMRRTRRKKTKISDTWHRTQTLRVEACRWQ